MSSSLVIANYETLSALFGEMLEAATAGEWEQLIKMEQQCNQWVATMRSLDAETTLAEADRQRKNQLINKILADDAEIRSHVQAWMSQLELSIQSNRQEQRLLHAYGL